MKKNIFILLVGLLSCQLVVFAQTGQENRIDIEIESDTTIVVRDLFGADCKLYGDKILSAEDKTKILSSADSLHTDTKHYTVYGGDGQWFSKRIKKLNPDNSQYIFKDSDRGVCIKFSYSDMADNPTIIRFYGAIHNNVLTERTNSTNGIKYWGADGWLPNKNQIYSVNVIKKSPNCESNDTSTPVQASVNSNENKSDITSGNNETIIQEIKDLCFSLRDEIYSELGWAIAGLFILFFIFIVIFIMSINKLDKKIKKLKPDENQSQRGSEDINVDKIKQAVISKIKSAELSQKISNEDIYSIVNKSDIQLYIQSVIAGKVEDYLRNKVNIPTPSNVGGIVQQTQIGQPKLRTTKVEYLADQNSFIISENPTYEIFEIYSVNGEFYYTIIDDSTLRRNLLSVIDAYTKCIEHRLDSLTPATVEVLKDGRLIKNGDMYVIDTNCKLQVSLK